MAQKPLRDPWVQVGLLVVAAAVVGRLSATSEEAPTSPVSAAPVAPARGPDAATPPIRPAPIVVDEPKGPKTWIVDREGREPFDARSLVEGVAMANEGDRIFIRGGTYDEALTLSKSLVLQGDPEAKNKVLIRSKSPVVVETTIGEYRLMGLTLLALKDPAAKSDKAMGTALLVGHARSHVWLEDVEIESWDEQGLWLEDGKLLAKNLIVNQTGIRVSSGNFECVRCSVRSAKGAALGLSPSRAKTVKARISRSEIRYSRWGILARGEVDLEIDNSGFIGNERHGLLFSGEVKVRASKLEIRSSEYCASLLNGAELRVADSVFADCKQGALGALGTNTLLVASTPSFDGVPLVGHATAGKGARVELESPELRGERLKAGGTDHGIVVVDGRVWKAPSGKGARDGK